MLDTVVNGTMNATSNWPQQIASHLIANGPAMLEAVGIFAGVAIACAIAKGCYTYCTAAEDTTPAAAPATPLLNAQGNDTQPSLEPAV